MVWWGTERYHRETKSKLRAFRKAQRKKMREVGKVIRKEMKLQIRSAGISKSDQPGSHPGKSWYTGPGHLLRKVGFRVRGRGNRLAVYVRPKHPDAFYGHILDKGAEGAGRSHNVRIRAYEYSEATIAARRDDATNLLGEAMRVLA